MPAHKEVFNKFISREDGIIRGVGDGVGVPSTQGRLGLCVRNSVWDPEPDPQDPHVLGPPGPLVRGTDRLRILPFSHKDVGRTEIMLAK
jgi:hypothetical protein